jgi:hypothetical protein
MTTSAAARIARHRPDTVGRLARALRTSGAPLLLQGPRGSGLGELVALAAGMVVCREGGCDSCDDCRAVVEGRHPDVRIVEGSPAIEEVRGLVAHARQSAATWRVAGLVGIERMSQVAPVVLKALEEPSPRTRWLLAASAVPPELSAVASRCVRIAVEPPTPEEVLEVLEEAGVLMEPALVSLLPADLEAASLIAQVEDPAGWVRTWRDLPVLRRSEHPGYLAARLRPPGSLTGAGAEAAVRLGLGVLVRAHPHEPRWGAAALRASSSLARRLSIPLVLAELVTREG